MSVGKQVKDTGLSLPEEGMVECFRCRVARERVRVEKVRQQVVGGIGRLKAHQNALRLSSLQGSPQSGAEDLQVDGRSLPVSSREDEALAEGSGSSPDPTTPKDGDNLGDAGKVVHAAKEGIATREDGGKDDARRPDVQLGRLLGTSQKYLRRPKAGRSRSRDVQLGFGQADAADEGCLQAVAGLVLIFGLLKVAVLGAGARSVAGETTSLVNVGQLRCKGSL